MRDPYSVLGVPRSVSEKELKSAYRKLAKANHPDQNRTDPKAQQKFAEISAAYDFLSDKDKKAAYDRGEIDADGNPKFAGFGGAGMGGGARAQTTKGEDANVTLAVSLEDAHTGGSVPLRLPTNKVVNVKLPDKVEDGQQIRLKGQGMASPWGGEPGDAIVTVKFERHPKFRRDGADLRVDVPITLYEAVLGGKVRVPTLDGEVELTLPANVNTSKALRLKGKGLHGNGDLYASLKVVLPEKGDPDLESLMRFWRDQKPYKVRD